MALTFDVSKIENYAENYPDTEEGNWNLITYAVVHRMMHTSLGFELNENNAAEFWARCKFLDKYTSPMLVDGESKDQPMTIDDIKGHIGLTCNVAPEKRAEFLRRYIDFDMKASVTEYASKKQQPA